GSEAELKLFEKAAAQLQGLVQVASREQLLYLYARYKQVQVGNCNTPKPSFFDFEGKQKWEAWKASKLESSVTREERKISKYGFWWASC
uniref:ACB domain-containing protein n=1 Tax=Bos indicus x Bos taurus TaxID=30522 RepID=A0A4W2ITX6_BOBOX